MADEGESKKDPEADVKKSDDDDGRHGKEEKAVVTSTNDDIAKEQPKKRTRREQGEATKCSKCKKRHARRGCSELACIACCSDLSCEAHREARENALWKEQVLKGTTDVQNRAKAKRASAIRPGTFREQGFLYMNDTIMIWNRQQFMQNRKWREDAVRRAEKRKARSERTTKPIGNSVKRFRKVMEDLYHKSLERHAGDEEEDSVTSRKDDVETKPVVKA